MSASVFWRTQHSAKDDFCVVLTTIENMNLDHCLHMLFNQKLAPFLPQLLASALSPILQD